MEQKEQIEELLLRLHSTGKERDFKRLFDLLYDRFFRIAFYYVKQDEWAQEIVLDVFMTLWNKRNELIHIQNFDNYSFIMLKNASLQHIAKNKVVTLPIDEVTLSEDTKTTPEDELLNEELLLVYIHALEELPPRCREVYILIREQGLSYKEVAEKLSISAKTVDAQLQKAVSRLKDRIKAYRRS